MLRAQPREDGHHGVGVRDRRLEVEVAARQRLHGDEDAEPEAQGHRCVGEREVPHHPRAMARDIPPPDRTVGLPRGGQPEDGEGAEPEEAREPRLAEGRHHQPGHPRDRDRGEVRAPDPAMHGAVPVPQPAPELERTSDEREAARDDMRVERGLHDSRAPVVVVGEADARFRKVGQRGREVGHDREDRDRER